jgi:sulfite reductase (NADPH) flavoprotein alpha-component
MTTSIWRYSHLALAVSSFLLLTLASVTGIILAFQPISEKTHSYRVNNFDQITLAQTLPVLRKTYPGISELTVDANQFVQIKGSDNQGKNLTIFADPQSGKSLGTPSKKSEFFEWVTALHRSLFLHEAGRFFIGLTAFLLLLITISGTILIIQRQRGIKRFFTTIVRDSFAQYYHVVLGRLSLIPIFIIAITGTYLSLSRFGLVDTNKKPAKIDFDAIKSAPIKDPSAFAVFKSIKLAEVESVEFPFSEDPEDYYTLKLRDREITVNQITGDILSTVNYPTAVMFTNMSLDLHTGRTNALWAIILAVASGNILFFIYSGFAITWKRVANRVKNKYKAHECEYIILVGSENGTTYNFARSIHQQLLKQGRKSFITELNYYTAFAKAQQLIVLTATYGLGESPTNANKFLNLLQKYPQPQPVRYSVLGFGSHAYPDFCKYSFEVNQLLSHQQWASPLTDVYTVNDKSPHDFSIWAEAWSQQAGLIISASSLLNGTQSTRFRTLQVTSNTSATVPDDVFSIRLRPKNRLKVTSGDLLAIYPENDHRERLYSIGVIDKEIQLSVRLHEDGLGSGYLHRLKPDDSIRARIINNKHFHFPNKAPQVVMVSNGTGIAPFLGMISQNKRHIPCHLYCGFRDVQSLAMYQNFLEENKAAQRLDKLQVAFSRDGYKQYVSDLVNRDIEFIDNMLSAGGIMMICGSLSMQKDVLAVLERHFEKHVGKSVSYYQSHGQILMDCY